MKSHLQIRIQFCLDKIVQRIEIELQLFHVLLGALKFHYFVEVKVVHA